MKFLENLFTMRINLMITCCSMLQASVQNRGLVSDVTIGLKLEIKMFAEIASGHFQSITPILR